MDRLELVVGEGDVDERRILPTLHVREQLVEEEVEGARAMYPKATIACAGIGEGEIPVKGNEMLRSVVGNLIHNAVQHAEEDAVRVWLTLEVESSHVRFEVADDGPGIPDARKQEIFARNEKGLDSAGTGMGLYLVDRVIDRVGGRIMVKDRDPSGTAFVIELPRPSTETGSR